MASGIRDKVVILGMGCSRFGERWDADAEDLIVEAYEEALGDAGIETKQIDAAWFATAIEEQHVGKSGVPPGDLKRAMAHISVKSHDNGSRNPKAHLKNKISMEQVLNAAMVAEPLGLYDCCGVSDGAACAIVTTPDIARGLGKRDLISVKALQLAVSNGVEAQHNSWDGSYFATTRVAAKRAYHEAGIDDARAQIDLVEAHDCF